MRIRILLVASFVFALGVFGAAPVGAADPPTNPECWGVVVSQRASTDHDLGQHISSQSEPRSGIGNVANDATGSYQPGQLGTLLASIDGDAATHCP